MFVLWDCELLEGRDGASFFLVPSLPAMEPGMVEPGMS